MSVKLLLNPAAEAKEYVHTETGVAFMIRPVSPEKHNAIRAKSLGKDGALDLGKWGANYAVAAIAGWGDGVGDADGPLECDEDNLRTFGRNQAINIMPWVIDRAESLDQFRAAEEEDAKKD